MNTNDLHSVSRPVIFDYRAVHEYLSAMSDWNRRTFGDYSIRKECAGVYRCSPSLVTRVLQGKRVLTPDRVDGFSKILRLNHEERGYLRRWVTMEREPKRNEPRLDVAPLKKIKRRGSEKNHLLKHWLNPYVKDLIHLKGFRPDASRVHRMLGGLATIPQIEKTLKFLFHEGFLRRTVEGKVVEDHFMVTVKDNPSDEKLRAFHSKALDITKRNLSLHSPDKRKELVITVPLTDKQVGEVRDLLREYYEKLLHLIEEQPVGDEHLYQIMLYLTPIGRAHEHDN